MKVLVLSSLYPNDVQRRHGIFIEHRVAHLSTTKGLVTSYSTCSVVSIQKPDLWALCGFRAYSVQSSSAGYADKLSSIPGVAESRHEHGAVAYGRGALSACCLLASKI